MFIFFFFNDTATTEIYTLSLHDALPIYYAFVEDLATAELSPIKNFEEDMYFEGCLPVETIARRGPETLRFGPMKPVGLPDPRTGEEPFAVVQLRQDDAERSEERRVGKECR